MKKISFMDSFDGSNNREVEINKILKSISENYYKERIEKIRSVIKEGEKKEADELKKMLPGFTPCGFFNDKRTKESLEEYSGIIHLDYDKIDKPEELKELLNQIPYTYASFISPSGKGLKVFIKTNSTAENHKEAFNLVRDFYDGVLQIESDASVKDLARFCYVSYDPNLYLDEEAEIFDIKEEIMPEVSLDWVWDFTSNITEFIDGNRNNFIHIFSCNANRYGFEVNDTYNYASNYSDSSFTSSEIEEVVYKVFHRNAFEKGKVSKLAIFSKTEEKEVKSPFIDNNIYEKLPTVLKEACKVFEGRERDVFLTTAFSVISGGLYNVSGLYRNAVIYPNLFSMVIAPPASGKGSMKYSRMLGDCYHNFLLTQSIEAKKKYKKERLIYEKKIKKAKEFDLDNIEEPKEPKAPIYFIPGDTSSAMFIKHLEDNDGLGCLCETEADTINKTLKQDWGGYSDMLRKGFHSELISKSRKKDLEYTEIKEPKFSVAITGTPNQVNNLISSTEDGLFSRFLFYSYRCKAEWKDTYTDVKSSKDEIFEGFSAHLCELFKNNKKQFFRMTKSQGNELDNRFRNTLNNYSAIINDCEGVIIRLGAMTFKLAMTLSSMKSDECEIVCSDDDFNIAMELIEKVYLHHSLSLFELLKDNNYTETQTTLLNYIPNEVEVTRSQINKCAKSLKINERTLTNLINKFIANNDLKKIKNGVYIKR